VVQIALSLVSGFPAWIFVVFYSPKY